MKIGLVPTPSRSPSVKHVMTSVRDALAVDHELIYLHPSIAFAPEEEQHRIAGEFVAACDAIVGIVHPAVLTMRERMGSQVPYFLLMLGTMARGAFRFRKYLSQLSTNDALIVNCEADRLLCERFFANARAPVVPLAFDERAFAPLDDGERAEIRDDFGFAERARIVLYSGRVLPEKNLHTVFRAFSTLLQGEPDAHLVLAGQIGTTPFAEFGVSPTNFPLTLARMTRGLDIPEERVLCAGGVSPGELRELYNMADVAINLTLHHDENFGLAQVEAMACGLPVVGSMWGGLKDTIVDGCTGHRVSTVLTPLGVKVSWWEAANRVLSLLRDRAGLARFREEGPRHATLHYSQARLRDALGALLRAPVAAGPAEPLRATDFAEEFWSTCDPDADARAPFRRGGRSMELYRELIEPYTGLSPLAVRADEPLEDAQVLSLATPIGGNKQIGFWQDDPLYPLEFAAPARHVRSFQRIGAALAAEPVISLDRLKLRYLSRSQESLRALEWMIQAGLVLRSRDLPGWMDHRLVQRNVAEPLFSFQRLPADGVDFVVSG